MCSVVNTVKHVTVESHDSSHKLHGNRQRNRTFNLEIRSYNCTCIYDDVCMYVHMYVLMYNICTRTFVN